MKLLKRVLVLLVVASMLVGTNLSVFASAQDMFATEATTSTDASDTIIGERPLWRVSHDYVVPGQYVDLWIELAETSDFGFFTTGLTFRYDPAVLANPSFPASFFDGSLMSDADWEIFYNFEVQVNLGVMTWDDVRALSVFAHAWVHTSNAHLKSLDFAPPAFYQGTPVAGHPVHTLGPNIINLHWAISGLDAYRGSGLFVVIRFDVLGNLASGTEGLVEFMADRSDMTGQIPGQPSVSISPIRFENGGVTVVYNLGVYNQPSFNVRPVNQTPSQMVTGNVPLVHGTPDGNFDFLGWVRGGNIPAIGTNIADFDGTVFPAGHTANVPPASRVVYTAIWGNSDGYVGIPNYNLVIGNQPNIAVTGQTPSGLHAVPAVVPLSAGTPVSSDLIFMGWVRGNNIPGIGVNLEQWNAANPGLWVAANVEHSATITDVPVRYTALWGDGTYVGGGNNRALTIINEPAVVNPVTGQTAMGAAVVNNVAMLAAPGTALNLVPGTSASWTFLGWTTNLTALQEFLASWYAQFGTDATWADAVSAGVITAPGAAMPNNDLTIFAIWGNDAGVPFVPNGNLTISNRPATVAPVGQDPAAGVHSLPFGSRTLTAGTATNWTFLGWYTYATAPAIGETVIIPEGGFPVTQNVTLTAVNQHWVAAWGNDEGLVGTPNRPPIVIDVDDDGNVDVTLPPSSDIDYEIGEDDGNITITFPPETDRDNIVVNVPPNWDYEIIEDDNGNVVVVVTPPPGVLVRFFYNYYDEDMRIYYQRSIPVGGRLWPPVNPVRESEEVDSESIVITEPEYEEYEEYEEDYGYADDEYDSANGDGVAVEDDAAADEDTAGEDGTVSDEDAAGEDGTVSDEDAAGEDGAASDEDTATEDDADFDEDADTEDDAAYDENATDEYDSANGEEEITQEDTATDGDEAYEQYGDSSADTVVYEAADAYNDDVYVVNEDTDDREVLGLMASVELVTEEIEWTFTGWSTQRVAADVSEYFDFDVNIYTTPFDLFAQWRQGGPGLTHQVRFHDDFPSGAPHFVLFVVDGEYLTRMPPTAPTAPSGYRFNGWMTADGVTFGGIGTYITEDTDVFPRWQRIFVGGGVFVPPPPPGNIEIDVDNDGNTTVRVPGGTYTIREDEDGNIIVTVPDAAGRSVIVRVPYGWEYSYVRSVDGTVTVTIRPPRVSIHNAFLVGGPDGTIRPHDTITRAEVVTILFRLLDDDFRAIHWGQQNNFTDVNVNAWFNNAISTMTNAGIVQGADGEFRPNEAATRAEFSAMVARFFTDFEASTGMFTDIEGNWAEDYINLIAGFGIVQGVGDGTFNPDAALSRAEAAAIVNRMLNRIIDSSDDLLEGRTRWPDKNNVHAWYYLYLQEATHTTSFERLENGNVRWIEILPHLNWTVLEQPHSTAGSIVTAREMQQVQMATVEYDEVEYEYDDYDGYDEYYSEYSDYN